MNTFKVICKATGNDWVKFPAVMKIITKSRFFGLSKISKVISENEKVTGPHKDEVCVVTSEYISDCDSGKYYNLAGYPYGGYNAKYFIRMDEFTETQKEIAKKAEPALN